MRIAFNDLPQPVRERFVRLTKMGTSDPVVVMYGPGGSGGGWNWVGLLVGGGVGGYILQYVASMSFGGPSGYAGGYFAAMVALFIAFYCLFGIVYRFVWKPPPYREGVYAFPGHLVRTEGALLVISPTAEMGRPNVVHTYVNGGYRGSRVELSNRMYIFPYSSKDGAIAATDRILAAREAYMQAWASGNPNALGPLDPFFECTTTNNWKQPTPGEPRAATVPAAATLARWILPIAIGVGTAATIYSIKQDEYDEAVKRNKKQKADDDDAAETKKPKKKKTTTDDE